VGIDFDIIFIYKVTTTKALMGAVMVICRLCWLCNMSR
jgi:hypothetical protein